MIKTADNLCNKECCQDLYRTGPDWFKNLCTEDTKRVYQQSLVIVLIQAIKDLYPEEKPRVLYSMNEGFYAELINSVLSPREVAAIERQMRLIVEENRPICKIPPDNGLPWFNYSCGSVTAGFLEEMLPETGMLKVFKLHYHQPGLIVQYPGDKHFSQLSQYVKPVKIGKTISERRAWLNSIQVNSAERVNEKIKQGFTVDLIKLAEALHEKNIVHLTDLITESLPQRRLIIISGPSSSGKTTFSNRLASQLRVNRLKPITISLDDYYLPLEKCPKNEEGEYDFESIEALDLELFNKQLDQLMKGEEVTLPKIDFVTGGRAQKGQTIKIDNDHIIMIEGIHGLNEHLLEEIPRENILRIYISALTQLSISDYNRIHTTDIRLLRRIIRDYRYRSAAVEEVIDRWEAVRQGEIKNIFPYQEHADVMFNSGLFYELNVIRPIAEPLLQGVPADSPARPTAQRLLKILSFFEPMDNSFVPNSSVLREFIGGSWY